MITGKSGEPLLSWRVALLPFLGKAEYALYQKFRLDEPWDSEHNRPLADQMPDVFAVDASAANANLSTVVIPVGEGLFFDGEEAVVVHCDGSIHWIKPKALGESLWGRFTRNGKEPYE